MTEEVTLAPCPKCGCDKADTEIYRKYWFVECMRCEYFSDANYTEAEAIAAWNARANQPPAQDELLQDAKAKWDDDVTSAKEWAQEFAIPLMKALASLGDKP